MEIGGVRPHREVPEAQPWKRAKASDTPPASKSKADAGEGKGFEAVAVEGAGKAKRGVVIGSKPAVAPLEEAKAGWFMGGLHAFSNFCASSVDKTLTAVGIRSKDREPGEHRVRAPSEPDVQPMKEPWEMAAVSHAAKQARLASLDAKAPKFVERTGVPFNIERSRTGAVIFGSQLCQAGMQVLDLTRAKVGEARDVFQHGDLGRKNYDADVQESYESSFDQLKNLQAGLKYQSAFNGLSQERANELRHTIETGSANEKIEARAELNKALRQPVLSSDDEEYFQKARGQLKKIEQESLMLAERIVNDAIGQVQTDEGLLPSEKKALLIELETISKSVRGYLGDVRAEMLHAQKEWDQDKPTKFPVTIQDRAGGNYSVQSSFQAAGPAYGSQLARNRTPEETVAANFFETGLEVPGGRRVFEATRGATAVEFGLENKKERVATTRANVKKVLDFHTAKAAAKLPSGSVKGGSKEKPLVLKYQHLMLFTPDRLRPLAAKLPGDLCPLCNNEKLLAEETAAANEHWNKQTAKGPIQVEVTIDGQTKKIWVRYDIRTVNIPTCRFHEKMAVSPLRRWAVRHPKTDKMNHQALKKMTQDKKEVTGELIAQLGNASEVDKKYFKPITELMVKKSDLRRQIGAYKVKKKQVPPELMDKWLVDANTFAAKMKQIEALPLSDERRAYFETLQRLDQIEDTFADVNELIRNEAYMDPQVTNHNRYAIGARILILGNLLDISEHFGCRSAKDRTGLQDSEIKRQTAEAFANGRVLAYFEKTNTANMTAMDTNSGNAEFNPKANFGVAWWNLKDSRLEDPDRQKEYDAVQSGNALYIRPIMGRELK